MSDLLNRLRADIEYQSGCKYPSEANFNEDLLKEAVVEIERLQAIETAAHGVLQMCGLVRRLGGRPFAGGR